MIQLLLFGIALCAGTYGALNGSVAALLGATIATLLAASNLFGRLPHPTLTPQEVVITGKRHGWLFLIAVAIGCAGLATWQSHQNEFSFTSGYFWAAGMIVIVISSYLYDHELANRHGLQKRVIEEAVALKLRFTQVDWLLMGAISAVALFLRLYRLDDFLPTMHGDEGEMGLLALLALHGPASGISPTPLPLFRTAFLDHPTLFHYLQAGALLLFGESLTGLRTLSAIFGALCVPVVYGIGRIGWGRVAGITAGWLLAVSHLHLHYSRIALNNVQSIWFTALFILLMMVAFEKTVRLPPTEEERSTKSGKLVAPLVPYVWAGLVMGFSQYFYYGSRLIPVIALPLLLFLMVKRRLSWTQFLMITLATLIAYAPLAEYYSRNLPAFLNRTQGVSVFSPDGMAQLLGPNATWPTDLPLLIWEQVKRNAAFFVNYGDNSSFYFADNPAFDPLTVALFWLGLGILLARLYRFQEFALLMWFGLGFFLAGVATNNSPNGPRMIVITTSVYLIGSLLPQRLFNWSYRILPTGSRLLAIVVGIVIAVLTFQINSTAYFVTYARYTPNLMPISMAHEIRAIGSGYTFYLFGAPNFYANYSVLRFIAPETERYDVDTIDQLSTLMELQNGKIGVVVILLPHRLAALESVAERLPGGIREDHFSKMGNLMYVTYQVDFQGNNQFDDQLDAQLDNQDTEDGPKILQPEVEQEHRAATEANQTKDTARDERPPPLSPLQPTATADSP